MKNYVFENGFRVALNPEKGRLEEIVCGERRLNDGQIPFYAVKLRDRAGKNSDRLRGRRGFSFFS